MATATAGISGRIGGIGLAALGSSELSYGERNSSEELARIAVASASGAFLIGYAIIGSLDKQLRGALNSYYREYTEGNVKAGCLAIKNESLADRSSHSLGNICVFAAGARTRTTAIL